MDRPPLERLGDYIVSRRVALGCRNRTDLANTLPLTVRTLADIEQGVRKASRGTYAMLEKKLAWTPGSIDTILAGGEAQEAVTELAAHHNPLAHGSGSDALSRASTEELLLELRRASSASAPRRHQSWDDGLDRTVTPRAGLVAPGRRAWRGLHALDEIDVRSDIAGKPDVASIDTSAGSPRGVERVDATPFGHYQLQQLIGRGGMGEVYRAYETGTDSIVALRVLPSHLAKDVTFSSVRRESQAAAGINEPHVVPIHGFREIDDRLYLDMRLIEGRNLGAVLSDGGEPLNPAFAVSVIEQIGAALDRRTKRA